MQLSLGVGQSLTSHLWILIHRYFMPQLQAVMVVRLLLESV